MDRPTRLTSKGPVGGPSPESLTGLDAPSSSGDASGMGQSSTSDATTENLNQEAKKLLDRADILVERFRDLSEALANLRDFLPEEVSGRASDMKERVDAMIADLKDIRSEIRERGALETFRGVLEDYSEIAQAISAKAESLRSSGGASESAPDIPTEASSDASGGTATALMFFGGAALTAWFLFRESGGKGQKGEEAGNDQQSPGDVVPAEGALIGQFNDLN